MQDVFEVIKETLGRKAFYSLGKIDCAAERINPEKFFIQPWEPPVVLHSGLLEIAELMLVLPELLFV